MTTDVHAPAQAGPLGSRREATRAQGIRRFKWSVLAVMLTLFTTILTPVLFLQLYFSFHQWTIYLGSWWDADFVWFELFRELFTDPRFGWSIVRSLLFSVGSTGGCFVIGFGLALLMYRPFAGRGIFYILFILPMLMVPIVIAYTAEMLLYQNGPINGILTFVLGHDVTVQWLSSADVALTTLMLLEIWNWVPFSFIIMMAGLAALPKEPIEAAQILGAGRWRIFREIQLPLLRPVIVLALILRFLESMAEFPKAWALFQGGPGTATETIPVYIYITTWQYFNISKGAAMSYIVMMLMIVIVLLAIQILQREKRALDRIYHNPRATETA